MKVYALEDKLKQTLQEGKDLVEVVVKQETKGKRLNVFANIIDGENLSEKVDDGAS